MRKIIVTGRVGNDAVIKVGANGNQFMSFSLANNEFGDEKNADGTMKASWFNVTVVNPNQFKMQKHITKGKLFEIIGNYSDRIYMSKTGTPMISRDILCDSINFVDTGIKQENKPEGAPLNPQPVQQTTQSSIPQVTGVQNPQPEPQVNINNNVGSESDTIDDLPF